MAVGGSKREIPSGGEFTKKVGFFEATVVAINPTPEEFKDDLGIELKEDSKASEYLSVGSDGTSKVRVDIWLQDVKTDFKTKVSFYIEDTKRTNKDKTKKQYVNSVGLCTWADSEDNLPSWFVKGRDYRVAYVGEEELVTFFRTWLGGLDYMAEDTVLSLDIKKILAGNLKEWKEEVDGEWCQTVGVLATVKTRDTDDGPKSYQNIYNKAFCPGYTIKNLRNVDYNDQNVLRSLGFKKSKELKMHERFVLNVVGEYGCKDFYVFKDLQDYDPENNIVETSKTYETDSADF